VRFWRKALDRPTRLSWEQWRGALVRTFHEMKADNLTDWAASLTYYALLALFPAMIVLVAIIGLAGKHPQTTNALLKIVDDIGPESAVDTFRKPLTGVIRNKGGAGALLGVGLVAALWSASGYVGAFIRAVNSVYEVDEGRRFWKLRPMQLGMTLLMVIGAALVAIAVVLTGDLARAVGDTIGLGDAAVTTWEYAKWPVLFLVVMTMFAILYYVAPNVKLPGFRWITPGGLFAMALWLIASLGFAVYVAFFGSYNETYGTLGGVVILLMWLWITNLAVLLGAELNAELERARELAAGDDRARDRIQLPPREVKEQKATSAPR
jgi:membrane protein